MSSSICPAIGVPVASAIAHVPSLAVATASATSTARTIDATAAAPMGAMSAKPIDTAAVAQSLHNVNPAMPPGLCKTLASAVEAFPLRVMIVDNSGSMATDDGHRLVAEGKSVRKLKATRWQELGDEVVEIATLSVNLEARTDFHMLNPRAGYSKMTVGPAWDGVPPLGASATLAEMKKAMKTSPGGTTPLTESVMQVVAMLEPYAPRLRQNGEQVCVIIATDGLPDNRQTFVAAMQHLQRLPVWIVIRLCTDDDAIVEYWNELDAQLETPLEVLDDVYSEAQEVHSQNKWLTYAPPLHSARLFGLPGKIFDDLDEKPLVPSQVREFMEDLLATGPEELPEPEVDLPGFVDAVKRSLRAMPVVYDPLKGQMRPWVDVHALERHIKNRGKAESPCAIM